MLTSFQFAQLASSAWFGPAACVQSSASSCQLVGSPARITYSVYYTLSQPGGAMFGSSSFASCPFAAVLEAVDKAWEAGAISGRQVEQAQAVVRAAEALFVGAPTPTPPAPAAVCATCGESADYFGECGCAYVAVPHSKYFNVAA